VLALERALAANPQARTLARPAEIHTGALIASEHSTIGKAHIMTEPQQPYSPPAAAPAPPFTAESDKQLAMWAHIGGVVWFLPSLIIWLIGKDRGPRTNVEGKEALNWQITFSIAWVAVQILSAILGVVGLGIIGFLLGFVLFALWVVNIVFSIIGGVTVNSGGSYRYPINFRFIK
jgi:uncharacterized Tic20 family protein